MWFLKKTFCTLVDHLFVKCTFVKLIWRVVHTTALPANIKNMFSNWLNETDKKLARIRVGVCVLFWAI
jgi:hypothetical protein